MISRVFISISCFIMTCRIFGLFLLILFYLFLFSFLRSYSCFRARSISRFPPGGPGRRSTMNPAACNIRLTTPLAQ